MSLEIIGSGFGRTGTASLKLALEQLGFGPCHHMEEVLAHPGQVAHWQAVAAGQPVTWDDVFAGYRAQVDWPGAHVWRELSLAYPAAKIIHTQRPEDDWWNSFSATIGGLLNTYREISLPPHAAAMMAAAGRMIGEQTFGAAFTNRDAALAAYRRRLDQVRAAIAPARLLVFNVAEGWEPLCRFLGVPVPATPFPRVNSTAQWLEQFAAKSH
ncbi:sulfotransferase family protein [Acidocella aquatica]|uniref:Sulfotransferase family protein n=1 Tax=Acidocella aquatica TaxID=1922313 RepID=A0ABQ6A0B8_9PROT|nr:sulfotransferase family protein [Acidocella aquatica]GLR65889.1 sulfotransferase family protein [Acidocella aquatica]